MASAGIVEGEQAINGAAAHLISPGDLLIIMSFLQLDEGILGELCHDLVLEDGQPVVSRDYRLATSLPTAGSLFIQGNIEHTHGLTSSLLSNIAVRSAEILRSITAGVPTPVGSVAG